MGAGASYWMEAAMKLKSIYRIQSLRLQLRLLRLHSPRQASISAPLAQRAKAAGAAGWSGASAGLPSAGLPSKWKFEMRS